MVLMEKSATVEDFVRMEIELWGDEAIDELIRKGFIAVKTNHGYRWILDKPLT